MKEIKIICDRCGKECADDLCNHSIKLWGSEPLDLCIKCYRSFVTTVGSWLKESEDEKA